MTREEAIDVVRRIYQTDAEKEALAILIPELRESEDERIINTLYYLCKEHDWLNGATKEQCFAYLERQKRLKWLCRIIHSRVVNKELSLAEESELGKWIDKWLNHEPQLEKKWSEFDEDCLKRAIWYVENPAPTVVKDTNLVLWLQSLPERFNLQPKQEWSEEDEEIRQSIIKDIEWERNYTSATTGKVIGKYEEQINWLKALPLSLKKRNEDIEKLCSNEWSEEDKAIIGCIVCCLDGQFITEAARKQCLEWFNKHRRDFLNQPKQEWSEEDERMRQTAIEACKTVAEDYENSNERFYKCKYWLETKLKSLHPSWKPSENQMSMLLAVINAPNNAGSESCYLSLKSLYNDLKKL